jgi:[1-hydroxy-2-(trimethylamino)ethyl]phosphonate dioxygenase
LSVKSIAGALALDAISANVWGVFEALGVLKLFGKLKWLSCRSDAMKANVSPVEVVDQIFETFRERGHQFYGEEVTELQHALQCAVFADRAGEPPRVIAACLLHDYGHLLHRLGEDVAARGIDARHEMIGANGLNRFFAPEVVEPVRLHVAAKRYLCWKDPQYLQDLSEASRQSLALQGGPMTDEEGVAFEGSSHFADAIALRRYDDMGKVRDMETPGLEHYRPLLESLVGQPA